MDMKHINCKMVIAIIIGTILSLSQTQSIYAAPQYMNDGQVFDPEFYAALYPDVVSVFGTNTASLYKHYKKYGKKEGRIPYLGATVTGGNVQNTVPQSNPVTNTNTISPAANGHSAQYNTVVALLNSCNTIWDFYAIESSTGNGFYSLSNACPTKAEKVELNDLTNGLIMVKRRQLENAAKLPNGIVPSEPGCYYDANLAGSTYMGAKYIYTNPRGEAVYRGM